MHFISRLRILSCSYIYHSVYSDVTAYNSLQAGQCKTGHRLTRVQRQTLQDWTLMDWTMTD